MEGSPEVIRGMRNHMKMWHKTRNVNFTKRLGEKTILCFPVKDILLWN